jgi:hypothetical protein
MLSAEVRSADGRTNGVASGGGGEVKIDND